MERGFDNSLIKLLKSETAREKWKRIVRITGRVLEKSAVAKGRRKKRTKITLTVKTARREYEIPVPERLRRKVEMTISKGDEVKIIAGRKFGSVICYGIKKIDKERQTSLISGEWHNDKS